MAFVPKNPEYAARVVQSFAQQTVMTTIGAAIGNVEPGVVEITMPFRADLCQQHGFLHAGIVTTLVDSACGYAALSLMPVEDEVVSVEFKINLLSPAVGQHFRARGEVVRAGKSITVCSGELVALADGIEKTVALMQATMMAVRYASA